MYEYAARLATTDEARNPVYDGDTVTLVIDLGFDSFRIENCRLYGIDAPELKTGNKKRAAKAATEYLTDMLTGQNLRIKTYKDNREKFGRILAEIWVQDSDTEISVNQQLIDEGYAVPYFGGKKTK